MLFSFRCRYETAFRITASRSVRNGVEAVSAQRRAALLEREMGLPPILRAPPRWDREAMSAFPTSHASSSRQRATRPRHASHDATASADRNTLRPAPATSIQGLLVSVFASEAGYALALAVAVPYGTGAVAIAIVVMCLLAILIKTRISRGR